MEAALEEEKKKGQTAVAEQSRIQKAWRGRSVALLGKHTAGQEMDELTKALTTLRAALLKDGRALASSGNKPGLERLAWIRKSKL